MNDNGSSAGSSSTTAAHQQLELLRTELDRVDRALLDTVRARLALCTRVAELKQRSGIAVLQPGRMHLVHRRAREYADDHGLSPEFVRALYDLLIGEACRVEEGIVTADTPAGPHRPGPGR